MSRGHFGLTRLSSGQVTKVRSSKLHVLGGMYTGKRAIHRTSSGRGGRTWEKRPERLDPRQ